MFYGPKRAHRHDNNLKLNKWLLYKMGMVKDDGLKSKQEKF